MEQELVIENGITLECIVEYIDGEKYIGYWLDGKLHRENGPAFIVYDKMGNRKIARHYINDELQY